MSRRRCACGAYLRSTNPGPLCSPCELSETRRNQAEVRPGRAFRAWSPEEILEAMVRWREERGEWPTYAGWRRSGEGHPISETVRKYFGTFGAALDEATATYLARGRRAA